MKLLTWNKKELMYGFVVIFLLLIVYMLGQQTTLQMTEYVDKHCPTAIITYVSPFGLSMLNSSHIPDFNFSMNTSGRVG